jgi:hypothetical protein
MTAIDLDKLKDYDRYLWAKVRDNCGGYTSGVREVDITTLSINPQARVRFAEWATLNQPPASVEPAAPAEPLPPPIDMNELLREEEAAMQRAADQAAARNRLHEYEVNGLEDTQHNADAIRTWLDDNVKGYPSKQGVDLAIQWLGPRGKNVLTWRKAEAAPPPSPEPEQPMGEVLEPWQLPLDAR